MTNDPSQLFLSQSPTSKAGSHDGQDTQKEEGEQIEFDLLPFALQTRPDVERRVSQSAHAHRSLQNTVATRCIASSAPAPHCSPKPKASVATHMPSAKTRVVCWGKSLSTEANAPCLHIVASAGKECDTPRRHPKGCTVNGGRSGFQGHYCTGTTISPGGGPSDQLRRVGSDRLAAKRHHRCGEGFVDLILGKEGLCQPDCSPLLAGIIR